MWRGNQYRGDKMCVERWTVVEDGGRQVWCVEGGCEG